LCLRVSLAKGANNGPLYCTNWLIVQYIEFNHPPWQSSLYIQSEAIVDFWDGANDTVILGDFNAEPDASEIDILRQAGLVDALADMEPA
jgi:hypothetical protein